MLNYVKFALLSSKMVTQNLCYILVKYYAGMITMYNISFYVYFNISRSLFIATFPDS
jgi:hypothetical protein